MPIQVVAKTLKGLKEWLRTNEGKNFEIEQHWSGLDRQDGEIVDVEKHSKVTMKLVSVDSKRFSGWVHDEQKNYDVGKAIWYPRVSEIKFTSDGYISNQAYANGYLRTVVKLLKE
jgi:hypothetical protein